MDNRDNPIFNIKLAGYLISRGFEVSNIKPHKSHQEKFVFYFKKHDKFEEEMRNYISINKI